VFGWGNKSNTDGSDLLLECLDGASGGRSQPRRGIFGEDAISLRPRPNLADGADLRGFRQGETKEDLAPSRSAPTASSSCGSSSGELGSSPRESHDGSQGGARGGGGAQPGQPPHRADLAAASSSPRRVGPRAELEPRRRSPQGGVRAHCGTRPRVGSIDGKYVFLVPSTKHEVSWIRP
jgi:hypothetical protein